MLHYNMLPAILRLNLPMILLIVFYSFSLFACFPRFCIRTSLYLYKRFRVVKNLLFSQKVLQKFIFFTPAFYFIDCSKDCCLRIFCILGNDMKTLTRIAKFTVFIKQFNPLTKREGKRVSE